jgi:UDP-N-acetylglucosamine--N-acetylmuramyl-(pentapeptide) pyrophosphoryl-undecaprenol N-acetylglucosamine transferase
MKVIALTWWWTWGHIYPLLSLYNYLKEDKNLSFIWVWEQDSLEEEEAIRNKIPFEDISAWKIRRYFDLRNFYEPLKNISGIIQWIQLIKKHKIDIIFSKWWYVSLPLCIAAKILWKKIYVHESDMTTWVSNNVVWNLATKIFYTFPNKIINWKRHILTWQILNPELIDYIDDLETIENLKLSVLIIAWSQWSTRIFENMLKILPDLQDVNFHIILWEKNMHYREKFKEFKNVVAHDYITQKRLWKIYKTVDIAITRAWATSLWELNSFWIHSIIIPLKESANNHQVENAKYFSDNFWSDIVLEENNMELEIFRLIQKYKSLRKVWLNLDHFFDPLKKIKEEIL